MGGAAVVPPLTDHVEPVVDAGTDEDGVERVLGAVVDTEPVSAGEDGELVPVVRWRPFGSRSSMS